MNENKRSQGKTIPFARSPRASRRGDGDIGADAKGAAAINEDWESIQELIRQQPEIDISKTMRLYSQVSLGRYQVDASRLAGRMLQFEKRFQRSPGSADPT